MKKLRDISEFRSPGEVASDNTLKAPNGKVSNLSDKLHKLVRTPEFIAWFGDWEKDPDNASKVVDKNGEPMPVFHGTPSYGFKEFLNDYKLPRNTDNETNNLGIWFASDKDVASKFIFDKSKGGVYEVFLNIRTPKVFTPGVFNKSEIEALERTVEELSSQKRSLGWSYRDMTPDERAKYDKIDGTIKNIWHQIKMLRHVDSFELFMNARDKYARYIDGVEGKEGAWLNHMVNMNKEEANKKLMKEFTDNKHDGMFIVDTEYDAKKGGKITQYCVFDANDIKSVDNNGRFEKNNKNIYENVYIKDIDQFDI